MSRVIQPPAAPEGFSAEAFFSGIHWHQRWELFGGVFTPGRNPVAELWDLARLPADLSGKRVLDIGAWHGCFSFEAERRGAAEVVACSLEDPETTGFDRMRQALGSKVRYVQDTVYALSPGKLGTFDVVFFLGVLYHLRYPLLAVDRIRSIATDEVFIETHAIDADLRLRAPFEADGRSRELLRMLAGAPIWRQYRQYELAANDSSNWFGPNSAAVVEAFEAAGFDCRHTNSWGDRAAYHASVKRAPKRLLDGSYEGMSANRGLVGLDPAAADEATCVGAPAGAAMPPVPGAAAGCSAATAHTAAPARPEALDDDCRERLAQLVANLRRLEPSLAAPPSHGSLAFIKRPLKRMMLRMISPFARQQMAFNESLLEAIQEMQDTFGRR